MAATIMSTGQITIVDLTDQRTSSFYLQANASKIQVYDKEAGFSPDYTKNVVTITPYFFYGNEEYTSSLTSSNLSYKVEIGGDSTSVAKIGSADNPGTNKYYQVGNLLYIAANIESAGTMRIVATIAKETVEDEETGLTNGKEITADIEFARVDTGADGVSVSSITTQYGVSATQDSQPATWVDSISDITLSNTNKYLWVKQTTTFSNKETEEQIYIAGTYGDTGATGSAGRSVESITEQYYISNSKVSPTGGSWVLDAPTSIQANQYLWTRTEIVYTNPTGTEYVPSENGKCDTTWNLAVDEVTKSTEALNTLNASYKELKEDLQAQIDDAIQTHFGEGAPEGDNDPAKSWVNEDNDDTIKAQHSGDLYYDTTSGAAYRYVKDTDGVWKWIIIPDEALSAALKDIKDLQTEVDGKVTIFYGDEVPSAANVDDLWIQGADGDSYKCTESYTDGVTSTNWTDKWTLANSAVRRIDIEFAKTTSSTMTKEEENKAMWDTTSPEWEQGTYIWQRTHIYDGSGNTLSTSDPVCITSASRSITSVTNYYLRTTTNAAPSTTTSGWSETPTAPDKDNPYLWNYEKVEYTYGDPSTTEPALIGMYSKDGATGAAGRGIVSITEYYQAYSSGTGLSFAIDSAGKPTDTKWTTTVPATTDSLPYLWNAEVIQYTSGTIYEASAAQVIGYRGVGVSKVQSYYLVNNETTAPLTTDEGWKETYAEAGNVSSTNKYMWTYTKTTYTSGGSTSTDPVIIATYTKDGEDAIYTIVESNSHIIFSDTQTKDITLTATLYAGSAAITSGVTYAWTFIPSNSLITDSKTSTQTITRSQVTNIQTCICTITYNGKSYSDRITISDKTDPITCEITSSKGDKFTNGNVSTVLTATLYHSQKGKMSDDEMQAYYFNWKKYDKNGVEDTTFSPEYSGSCGGGSASATTYRNAIKIESKDVDSKAIFTCSVTTESPNTTST